MWDGQAFAPEVPPTVSRRRISRVGDAAGRLAKRRRRHLQPTYSSLPLRTDSAAGAGHIGFHADAHKPGAARRNWPTAAQGCASRQHRPRHHHQRARYFVCELTSRSSSMMGGLFYGVSSLSAGDGDDLGGSSLSSLRLFCQNTHRNSWSDCYNHL